MDQQLKPGKDYIGVGGGVLIFNKKGEVLLMRRGKKAKNEAGWWCKPGGTVSYGEGAAKAMERELKEELNIKVKIWGLLPHTDHFIKKEKQHWLAINFLADLKFGEPQIMEPEKCDEIAWFDIKKMPKKLTRTTKEPVKNFLEGKYIKL
jgi:mutator protein MutT